MTGMRDESQLMVIHGRFGGAAFLPWIARHAVKLGLRHAILPSTDSRIEIRLEGPAELIFAMEAACLLGPIEAWVERIVREPLSVGKPFAGAMPPDLASHNPASNPAD